MLAPSNTAVLVVDIMLVQSKVLRGVLSTRPRGLLEVLTPPKLHPRAVPSGIKCMNR